MNIFITGTDTNVGKTIVSAWICKKTNAKYWKPIQTGDDSDTSTIKTLSPHTKTLEEAYKFKTPLSPYDASCLENININPKKITLNVPDKTVIEGAGGVMVPIWKNFLMVDLAMELNSKLLIVAKSKLGFLNHIFMTTEILKNRNLDIIGIIINGKVDQFLITTIEKFSKLKVLYIFPYSSYIEDSIKNSQIPLEIMEVLK